MRPEIDACGSRITPILQAVLFLFLIAIVEFASAAPARSVNIGVPADSPPELQQNAQRFAKTLNEASGGRLLARTMETDYGADNDKSLQIRFVDLAGYDHYGSPHASIFNAIFGFKDLKSVERFLSSETGRQAFRVADGNKRVTLSYWHDGMLQLVAGGRGRDFAETGILGKTSSLALSQPSTSFEAQFSLLGFAKDSGGGDLRFKKLAVGAVDYVEASWNEITAADGPRSLLSGSTVIVTNHRYKGYLLVADPTWLSTLPKNLRALLFKEAQNGALRHNALIAAKESANSRSFATLFAIHEVPMRLDARERVLETLHNPEVPGFDLSKLLGHSRGYGTGQRIALESPRLPRSFQFWEEWTARSAAYGKLHEIETVIVTAGSRSSLIFPYSVEQKELAAATWHTWIENDEGIANYAEIGNEYDLNLALSRRSARSLVDAGPDLKAAIDAAVREGKKVLPLSIRPVALSGGLQLVSANIQLPLKVQLKRLETRSEDEEKKEMKDREDKRQEGVSERMIAELYDAAVLTVRVKANPGVSCPQVLFSVWDERGIVPVDMLVATIPIWSEGEREKCQVPKLQGGFGSFLGVTESTPKPDAGLNLFEYLYAGEVRTVAMLVSGADYEHSAADMPIEARGVYVWFLDRPLSSFIDGELSEAVVAARRSGGNYEYPADHLRKTLFPPADAQAQMALKALQDIVAGKQTSAWINVRSVRANGKYFYPPLALMAAKGGALPKRPMFVYPLPTARLQGERCIGVWNAVIPEKLDGDVVDVEGIDLPGRMQSIRKFEPFRTFLSNTALSGDNAMAPKVAGTEGLLLLAHHGNGNLWFSDNGTKEKVLPTENNRIFANGSAAILNACHTASGVGYNQDLIEKFNRNGMDAMLVTPFAMDKVYGEHFARRMVKAIHRVYNEGKGVTLAALMDQVAQEVMSDPASGTDAQGMLEMVFVGNATIRLCDKP